MHLLTSQLWNISIVLLSWTFCPPLCLSKMFLPVQYPMTHMLCHMISLLKTVHHVLTELTLNIRRSFTSQNHLDVFHLSDTFLHKTTHRAQKWGRWRSKQENRELILKHHDVPVTWRGLLSQQMPLTLLHADIQTVCYWITDQIDSIKTAWRYSMHSIRFFCSVSHFSLNICHFSFVLFS